MRDSTERESLEEKRVQLIAQRLESVKRWVEYIQQEPPERWGEQQNRLVNSQLESARATGLTASHYLHIEQSNDERTPP